MLYKHGKNLIEANSPEEAAKILGTNDFKTYKKPSKKAFMMWCWIRCDRKDGRLLKHMMGLPADFLEEYQNNPNIVNKDLRHAGIVLDEWAMVGEKDYDTENHDEWFYKRKESKHEN